MIDSSEAFGNITPENSPPSSPRTPENHSINAYADMENGVPQTPVHPRTNRARQLIEQARDEQAGDEQEFLRINIYKQWILPIYNALLATLRTTTTQFNQNPNQHLADFKSLLTFIKGCMEILQKQFLIGSAPNDAFQPHRDTLQRALNKITQQLEPLTSPAKTPACSTQNVYHRESARLLTILKGIDDVARKSANPQQLVALETHILNYELQLPSAQQSHQLFSSPEHYRPVFNVGNIPNSGVINPPASPDDKQPAKRRKL